MSDPKLKSSTDHELADQPHDQLGQVSAKGLGCVPSTSVNPYSRASPPEELADRLTTLHRWAAAEVICRVAPRPTVVVGLSFSLKDVFSTVPADHPDQQFLLVDACPDEPAPRPKRSSATYKGS